jgi:hypothetical protein
MHPAQLSVPSDLSLGTCDRVSCEFYLELVFLFPCSRALPLDLLPSSWLREPRTRTADVDAPTVCAKVGWFKGVRLCLFPQTAFLE